MVKRGNWWRTCRRHGVFVFIEGGGWRCSQMILISRSVTIARGPVVYADIKICSLGRSWSLLNVGRNSLPSLLLMGLKRLETSLSAPREPTLWLENTSSEQKKQRWYHLLLLLALPSAKSVVKHLWNWEHYTRDISSRSTRMASSLGWVVSKIL